MDREWGEKAKRILKAEMALKGVTVAKLAELRGENVKTLTNRLSEGTFSAGFFLRCLNLIGSKRFED